MSQFVFATMKEVVHEVLQEIEGEEEVKKLKNVEKKMDFMEIQEPFQLESIVQDLCGQYQSIFQFLANGITHQSCPSQELEDEDEIPDPPKDIQGEFKEAGNDEAFQASRQERRNRERQKKAEDEHLWQVSWQKQQLKKMKNQQLKNLNKMMQDFNLDTIVDKDLDTEPGKRPDIQGIVVEKVLTSNGMSPESIGAEMYQKATSSLRHQIDILQNPQVLQESLEDFVATIPSATLDHYYDILSHDIIKVEMTNQEKRVAILKLSMDCFGPGIAALGFLKECQLASLSGKKYG